MKSNKSRIEVAWASFSYIGDINLLVPTMNAVFEKLPPQSPEQVIEAAQRNMVKEDSMEVQ